MNKVLSAIATAAFLVGCASSNPDLIQRNEAQRLSQVQDAIVLSSRPVTIDGSQSGGGAVAGGVVGGVAGSSVGGHREGIVVGVIGAVVGAVVGNAIERATTKEHAVEVLIQMSNGERRSIVQAQGDEAFQSGDAVILVTTGSKTRLMKAPAVKANKRI